jgi:hypothetical protein
VTGLVSPVSFPLDFFVHLGNNPADWISILVHTAETVVVVPADQPGYFVARK